MAKANRQKYNFLTALLGQLHDAADESDSLYDDFRSLVRLLVHEDWKELNGRVAQCEQWLAELESALEELDSDGSASLGEVAVEDDDGDDYDELDGVEPQMGGERQPDRRVAPPVGGTSNGQGDGRSRVSAPTKERISRGQR